MNCNLPVFNWGWITNGGSTSAVGQNGFLVISSGEFRADPAAAFSTDSNGRFASQQTPVLYGDGSGAFFDAAFHRWVPAAPAHVLPDGSAYVYELQLEDGSFEIHLVQVTTAYDHVIAHFPYDSAYSLIAFQSDGVYLQPIVHRSGIVSGLWRLDPATGSLDHVTNSDTGTWQTVAYGAAWGGPGGLAGSTLTRLDLSTGATTILFQHAVAGAVFEGYGYGVSLVGFDAAQHPLVEVFPPGGNSSAPPSPGPPEVWLARDAGDAAPLSGINLSASVAVPLGISDSHGLWLEGADGIYLYSEAKFQRAAPLAPQPYPNYMIEGACA